MVAQVLVDPGEGKGRGSAANEVFYAVVVQHRRQQDDLKRLLVAEEFEEVAVDSVGCIQKNDEALVLQFCEADQKSQRRLFIFSFADSVVGVVNGPPVKDDVVQVRLVVVRAFEAGNDLTVERDVAELFQALVEDADAVVESSRAAFFDLLKPLVDFVEFRFFRVEFFGNS